MQVVVMSTRVEVCLTTFLVWIEEFVKIYEVVCCTTMVRRGMMFQRRKIYEIVMVRIAVVVVKRAPIGVGSL